MSQEVHRTRVAVHRHRYPNRLRWTSKAHRHPTEFSMGLLGPSGGPPKRHRSPSADGLFGPARLETRAQDAGHARFFPSSLKAAERIRHLIGPADARRGGAESHPCCWPRLNVAPKAGCLRLRTPPRRPRGPPAQHTTLQSGTDALAAVCFVFGGG